MLTYWERLADLNRDSCVQWKGEEEEEEEELDRHPRQARVEKAADCTMEEF